MISFLQIIVVEQQPSNNTLTKSASTKSAQKRRSSNIDGRKSMTKCKLLDVYFTPPANKQAKICIDLKGNAEKLPCTTDTDALLKDTSVSTVNSDIICIDD